VLHRRILRRCVALRAYTSFGTMRSVRTILFCCLLAPPTLAADTILTGKVVGVHHGDTLTLRIEEETLKA